MRKLVTNNYLVKSSIPVLISLTVLIIWLLPGIDYPAFFSMIFSSLVVPIYLTVLNNKYFTWEKAVIHWLATIIVSALCVFIYYASWGISTGRFFYPDLGTKLISLIAGILALSIVIVGLVIITIRTFLLNRKTTVKK